MQLFGTSSRKWHQVDVRAWRQRGASEASDSKLESSDINCVSVMTYKNVALGYHHSHGYYSIQGLNCIYQLSNDAILCQ